MAVDIGEAVIAAAMPVGQSFVIEAHDVQDRRVQVVDVDLVLHGVPAEFVGRPVDVAGANAAPGHPHGEPEGVVLAPVGPLGGRGAAELAAPEDQGVLQQAVRLQVAEEGGDRAVDRGACLGRFSRMPL